MSGRIASIAELESVIGKTPPAVNLKVIDHLDENALRWIAASPLAFAGFGEGAEIAVTLAGGEHGFARGEAKTLYLPLATVDDPDLARPGAAFGSLFLAPGIGETLRVNGRVAAVEAGEVSIAVEECYGHCAKALIRSDFWAAEAVGAAPAGAEAFIAASRFMALATADGQGRADLSPKGDPAGCMARYDGARLWFADRPGNRRVDSFRNIVTQPRMAAVLLVPGSDRVAVVSGAAQLTTDEDARASFEVRGKTPHLAICVEAAAVELRTSAALARARLWPVGDRADVAAPAKMFAAHVKLNRDKGLGARIAGAVVSIPGLMQRGLDKDYESNLY